MDGDIRKKIAEWKKRNGRSLAVWTAFLTAGALLVLCGAAAAGCSENMKQKRWQNGEEGGSGQEEIPEARNAEGRALSGSSQKAGDRLAGGSSGRITYEIRSLEKGYEADDGMEVFRLRLSWPFLLGSGDGIEGVNVFFEKWAQETLQEYEADENSTRQSALEVYRESRGAEWAGPWGEEYRVRSVGVCAGYASVLMDCYLYEGSVHGMPYREDFAFDLSDGHRAELLEMSGHTREEWEKLLREKFLAKGSQEEGWYADAQEILEQFDFAKAGWYFTDEGIVFYLPPYTVAPYDAGYVEVIVPFEEARIK